MPKVNHSNTQRKEIPWGTHDIPDGLRLSLAILEQKAGIDVILVGDSMGMVVFGYDSPCRSRWTS